MLGSNRNLSSWLPNKFYVSDQMGYKSMFSPSNGSIIYSNVVDRIKLLTEGPDADKIEVFSSSSGTSFIGLKVILTVSLGVLKRERIKFVPSLPDYFQSALSRVDMANENKLFLKFASPFWDNNVFRIINSKVE